MKKVWARSWHPGRFSINPGVELLNWGVRLTIDGSWGYWEWITQVGPFWLYLSYMPKWRREAIKNLLGGGPPLVT